MTAWPDKPIDQWASTDVLAAVVDVEIAVLLRRTPSKDEALLALAARRELEDRMRRHRWPAMETARRSGASWAEIAAEFWMDAAAARKIPPGGVQPAHHHRAGGGDRLQRDVYGLNPRPGPARPPRRHGRRQSRPRGGPLPARIGRRRRPVPTPRRRHHNLACVITEPPGDEHTRHPAPTPDEVLAGVLRRTSGEKSATETLRDELESLQPETALDRRNAIVEGLRQAQNHSYQHTLRRQAQRNVNPYPAHSPAAPSITRSGPEL